MRNGLDALVHHFKKSTDPDDRTVELEDSVTAIGELRAARRAREMAEPPTPQQRHQAVHEALIARQRRARLERDDA